MSFSALSTIFRKHRDHSESIRGQEIDLENDHIVLFMTQNSKNRSFPAQRDLSTGAFRHWFTFAKGLEEPDIVERSNAFVL